MEREREWTVEGKRWMKLIKARQLMREKSSLPFQRLHHLLV
jgi:hypothetical protein